MMDPTSLILALLPVLSTAIAMPAPQNGDGGGGAPPDGGLGYDPSATGSDDAGSSGADNGFKLSTGATVAIGVVAGLVVIVGIVTTILFYLSKKRQWNLAARARGSLRRVGTGIKEVMTPRTPHKMTFSPIEKSRSGSDGAHLLKSQSKLQKQSSPSRGRDIEKALPEPNIKEGVSTYTATVSGPVSNGYHSRDASLSQTRDGRSHSRGLSLNTDIQGRTGQKIKMKKGIPAPVNVQRSNGSEQQVISDKRGQPESRFDIDSPKTPFMSRFVFGRR